MKNITLKIDDETYQKARIRAARKGTSVSAMVREFLIESTRNDATSDESPETPTSHEKRIADLQAFFAMMDAKAEARPPRTEPLTPMTREEIYAERIR